MKSIGRDGTTERFDLPVGERSFTATHQYLDDDPSDTASDAYQVRVRVADDDDGAVVGTTQITVLNVAPRDLTWLPRAAAVDEGSTALVDLNFDDPGSLDVHQYVIDWGDGASEAGSVTNRSLEAAHVYADNGLYTLRITLRDDDLGEASQTARLTVRNVDPVLSGVDSTLQIDEGASFTLASLGVTIVDPGFDNSANTLDTSNGGEISEIFTAFDVDWGDGTPVAALAAVDRVSGSPGVPTTAGFSHEPHVYADDGVYAVRLRLADDDGETVVRTASIRVVNVAPTLTLTSTVYQIDEGQIVSLPDLGTFTDPGFDNLLNTLDPANGGELRETFSYSIDWGDRTSVETAQLPVTRVSGSPGVLTVGSLSHDHLYVDNDRDDVPDNRYTVVVTLFDDDGGSHQQSLEVIVYNVNPTLQPLTAANLNAKALTTLEFVFSDPGQDSFKILVDWGDKLQIADPADRFVEETIYAGSTPEAFALPHVYPGAARSVPSGRSDRHQGQDSRRRLCGRDCRRVGREQRPSGGHLQPGRRRQSGPYRYHAPSAAPHFSRTRANRTAPGRRCSSRGSLESRRSEWSGRRKQGGQRALSGAASRFSRRLRRTGRASQVPDAQ